ncbi:MAG: DUF4389 domain-containing protein [Actinomycetota bacterium]
MPRDLRFELRPDERMERWRPLAHWMLGLPLALVALLAVPIAAALVVVGAVGVLATGRWPDAPARGLIGIRRFQYRVATYLALVRRQRPALAFVAAYEDPGDDPLRFDVRRPMPLHRWVPLVNWLLALPKLVMLAVLWIGAIFAVVVGAVSIALVGRWPHGLADFVVDVVRWQARVVGYVEFLTTDAPRFSEG